MSNSITPGKLTGEHKVSWAILSFLFLYMLALNIMMPLHRDDYEYALIWGTAEKILAWPDVFQSLYIHYLTHGGRMVSFFVLDSFLLLGKEWFNLLNAFLFVALIVLIYWHSQREITCRFNPYLLLLIVFFSWLGLPHFALVNIWMTGACVYLLTAALIFAFLLPYNFALWQKNLLPNNYTAVCGMFLAGVIAGWTVENTAFTMLLIMAGVIFYTYTKRRTAKWMLAGFCGSALGFFLLVTAPGNFVRYKETKRGFVHHFTNLLAGSGEMLIYVMPIILFLILSWRILLKERAGAATLPHSDGDRRRTGAASAVTGAFVLLLLVSYLNGSFFSKMLGNFIYNNAAVPMGVASDKLKIQLFNTMSGVEEFGVYILLMILTYNYTCRKFSLGKADVAAIGRKFNPREVLAVHPACYYAAGVIALAVVNNLVMLGSPYFPARAGFGSVVFLIVGAASLLGVPRLWSFWLVEQKKYLASLILFVLVPMAAAVFYQYTVVHQENTARMAYVENQVKQGATYLELEPLSVKNRILRHVYFVELNNPVSKHGFRIYYRLEDLKVKE